MPPAAAILPATCIEYKGMGVLLTGLSGSGKSDLAMRLISRGSVLVADDQVKISIRNHRLIAASVPRLRGLLEVRGVGLLRQPVADHSMLHLAVTLVPREEVPRLPEQTQFTCEGLTIPQIALHAFDASTPSKILLSLAALERGLCEVGAFSRSQD